MYYRYEGCLCTLRKKIYFTNRVKAIPANWKTSQEAADNF